MRSGTPVVTPRKAPPKPVATRLGCVRRERPRRARQQATATSLDRRDLRCGVTCASAKPRSSANTTSELTLRRLVALPLDLFAQAFVLGPELGRVFLAEVLGLEHGTDFDFAFLARHRV